MSSILNEVAAAATSVKQQSSNEASCQWITVEQVEHKLRITRSTIYRWRRLGVLKGYRLKGTRSVYFLESEVDDFLRQNPITEKGRLDKTGLLLHPTN